MEIVYSNLNDAKSMKTYRLFNTKNQKIGLNLSKNYKQISGKLPC